MLLKKMCVCSQGRCLCSHEIQLCFMRLCLRSPRKEMFLLPKEMVMLL